MLSPQKNKPLSICVYCAARVSDNPAYAEVATQVGRWLGKNNIRLVYGGGNTGLMGAIANAALENGAEVYGIIPARLMEVEMGHTGITELRVVKNMHERKQAMAEASDAFLTLPGGIGTFEEFFEAWTWRQLSYHANPIGLLNTNGYYDKLLEFTKSCITAGYMSQSQLDMLTIETEVEPMMQRLYKQMIIPKEETSFKGI